MTAITKNNRIGNQMKKGRKHLTLSQRIIIENGLRVGDKIRKIAKADGVGDIDVACGLSDQAE